LLQVCACGDHARCHSTCQTFTTHTRCTNTHVQLPRPLPPSPWHHSCSHAGPQHHPHTLPRTPAGHLELVAVGADLVRVLRCAARHQAHEVATRQAHPQLAVAVRVHLGGDNNNEKRGYINVSCGICHNRHLIR